MAAEVNHAHASKTRKLPASSFRFSVSLVAVLVADSRALVVAESPCLVVAEFLVEVAVVLVCLVCQS
jgi:hypothetical protein